MLEGAWLTTDHADKMAHLFGPSRDVQPTQGLRISDSDAIWVANARARAQLKFHLGVKILAPRPDRIGFS